MKKRNIKYVAIFLLGFLFIGIIQTIFAGHFLEGGLDNRRVLNIIALPFHILQLAFLVLAINYSGETKFSRNSFWFSEENAFHPAFVSVYAFRVRTFFSLLLFFVSFNFFVDWYMKTFPEHYILFFNNLIILIFIPIVSRWIGLFLNKFEKAVEGVKNIFEEEEKFKNYRSMLKKNISSRKEIFIILFFLIALRTNEMIFPDLSWTSAAGYVYPLIPLWWSLAAVPFWGFVLLLLVSVFYSYYQFSKSLFQLAKEDNIKVYLFHSDGCSGLKSVVDFVYWLSSRLLIMVAIYSFGSYISTSYFSQEISVGGLVNVIFVVNVFSFLALILPLMILRRFIKKRKEQERELIMDKIRQKEEIITQKESNDISKDLSDLKNLFMLVDKIDSVNEWLIGRKIKLDFSLKITLGFIPVIFELLKIIF